MCNLCSFWFIMGGKIFSLATRNTHFLLINRLLIQIVPQNRFWDRFFWWLINKFFPIAFGKIERSKMKISLLEQRINTAPNFKNEQKNPKKFVKLIIIGLYLLHDYRTFETSVWSKLTKIDFKNLKNIGIIDYNVQNIFGLVLKYQE